MLKKLPIATSEGTIVVGTSARVTPAVKFWEANGIDVRHLKVSEKCWNISWVGELSIVSEIFQHLLYDSDFRDSADSDIVPEGGAPKNSKGHISKAVKGTIDRHKEDCRQERHLRSTAAMA